jgi:hypothetical protein
MGRFMTWQTTYAKARSLTEAAGRFLATNAPTLIFGAGLVALCVSVSQWSAPAAGVIAGVTLMVIGGAPAVLTVTRARARKD